jgi:hypothetical protein
VNAVNSQARATRKAAVPTLEFWKKMARQMIENWLNNDGITLPSPRQPSKRVVESVSREHELVKRPTFTGSWDEYRNNCWRVMTEYLKLKCVSCPEKVQTYCTCNKKVSMCTACWGMHLNYSCTA